jgi:hypothetical protein
MWYLIGETTSTGLSWICDESPNDHARYLEIRYVLSATKKQRQKREAINAFEQVVWEEKLDWLRPADSEWSIDLDVLLKQFPQLADLGWFKGVASSQPDFEQEERSIEGRLRYVGRVSMCVYPDDDGGEVESAAALPEIGNSLEEFLQDHPAASQTACIVVSSDATAADDGIVDAIRSALKAHAIEGLLADDKQYHADHWSNLQTYLHGCGLTIAVVAATGADDVNSNVSLGVGYAMALNKPICLLKPGTLTTGDADLLSNLYREFDAEQPKTAIPEQIEQWFAERELA